MAKRQWDPFYDNDEFGMEDFMPTGPTTGQEGSRQDLYARAAMGLGLDVAQVQSIWETQLGPSGEQGKASYDLWSVLESHVRETQFGGGAIGVPKVSMWQFQHAGVTQQAMMKTAQDVPPSGEVPPGYMQYGKQMYPHQAITAGLGVGLSQAGELAFGVAPGEEHKVVKRTRGTPGTQVHAGTMTGLPAPTPGYTRGSTADANEMMQVARAFVSFDQPMAEGMSAYDPAHWGQLTKPVLGRVRVPQDFPVSQLPQPGTEYSGRELVKFFPGHTGEQYSQYDKVVVNAAGVVPIGGEEAADKGYQQLIVQMTGYASLGAPISQKAGVAKGGGVAMPVATMFGEVADPVGEILAGGQQGQAPPVTAWFQARDVEQLAALHTRQMTPEQQVAIYGKEVPKWDPDLYQQWHEKVLTPGMQEVWLNPRAFNINDPRTQERLKIGALEETGRIDEHTIMAKQRTIGVALELGMQQSMVWEHQKGVVPFELAAEVERTHPEMAEYYSTLSRGRQRTLANIGGAAMYNVGQAEGYKTTPVSELPWTSLTAQAMGRLQEQGVEDPMRALPGQLGAALMMEMGKDIGKGRGLMFPKPGGGEVAMPNPAAVEAYLSGAPVEGMRFGLPRAYSKLLGTYQKMQEGRATEEQYGTALTAAQEQLTKATSSAGFARRMTGWDVGRGALTGGRVAPTEGLPMHRFAAGREWLEQHMQFEPGLTGRERGQAVSDVMAGKEDFYAMAFRQPVSLAGVQTRSVLQYMGPAEAEKAMGLAPKAYEERFGGAVGVHPTWGAVSQFGDFDIDPWAFLAASVVEKDPDTGRTRVRRLATRGMTESDVVKLAGMDIGGELGKDITKIGAIQDTEAALAQAAQSHVRISPEELTKISVRAEEESRQQGPVYNLAERQLRWGLKSAAERASGQDAMALNVAAEEIGKYYLGAQSRGMSLAEQKAGAGTGFNRLLDLYRSASVASGGGISGGEGIYYHGQSGMVGAAFTAVSEMEKLSPRSRAALLMDPGTEGFGRLQEIMEETGGMEGGIKRGALLGEAIGIVLPGDKQDFAEWAERGVVGKILGGAAARRGHAEQVAHPEGFRTRSGGLRRTDLPEETIALAGAGEARQGMLEALYTRKLGQEPLQERTAQWEAMIGTGGLPREERGLLEEARAAMSLGTVAPSVAATAPAATAEDSKRYFTWRERTSRWGHGEGTETTVGKGTEGGLFVHPDPTSYLGTGMGEHLYAVDVPKGAAIRKDPSPLAEDEGALEIAPGAQVRMSWVGNEPVEEDYPQTAEGRASWGRDRDAFVKEMRKWQAGKAGPALGAAPSAAEAAAVSSAPSAAARPPGVASAARRQRPRGPNVKQLRAEAKRMGVPQWYNMRKAELQGAIAGQVGGVAAPTSTAPTPARPLSTQAPGPTDWGVSDMWEEAGQRITRALGGISPTAEEAPAAMASLAQRSLGGQDIGGGQTVLRQELNAMIAAHPEQAEQIQQVWGARVRATGMTMGQFGETQGHEYKRFLEQRAAGGRGIGGGGAVGGGGAAGGGGPQFPAGMGGGGEAGRGWLRFGRQGGVEQVSGGWTPAGGISEQQTAIMGAMGKYTEGLTARAEQLQKAVEEGRPLTKAMKQTATVLQTYHQQMSQAVQQAKTAGLSDVQKMAQGAVTELEGMGMPGLGAQAQVQQQMMGMGIIQPPAGMRKAQAAGGAFRSVFSGWEMMRMRRMWQMTGGPVFQQMIPAAAKAEATAWQAAASMGRFQPGMVPGGVAGGVMETQAAQRQGMIEAGRTGYRAWGWAMGATGGLKQAQAMFGPALGAGAIAGSIAAIAAPLVAPGALAAAGIVGPTAIAGAIALPIALGVAGVLSAVAIGASAYQAGDSTAENALKLARAEQEAGGDGMWEGGVGAGSMGQTRAGLFMRGYGPTGGMWEGGVGAPQGRGDIEEEIAQRTQRGQDLMAQPLAQLPGQERMAALNQAAGQLIERGGIWGNMDEGQIAGLVGQFAGYRPEWTAEEIAAGPRELEQAAVRGGGPAAFAGMAEQMGMPGREDTLFRMAGQYDPVTFQRGVGRAQQYRGMQRWFTGEQVLRKTLPDRGWAMGGVPQEAQVSEQPPQLGAMGYREQQAYQTYLGTAQMMARRGIEKPAWQPGMMDEAQAAAGQRWGQMQTGAMQQWGVPAAQVEGWQAPQGAQQEWAAGRLLGGDQWAVSMAGIEAGEPGVVTKEPWGLPMGTTIPLFDVDRPSPDTGRREAVPTQMQARMAQGQERMDKARQTGQWIGDWAPGSMWGIQDRMREVQRKAQAAGAGAQIASINARMGFMMGPGGTALEPTEGGLWFAQDEQRQMGWATTMGGPSPYSGQQFTGRFGWQQQQMDLGAAQFGQRQQLSRGIFETRQKQRRTSEMWQEEDFATRIERGGVQRDWTREDWDFTRGKAGMQFGWQMEDYEENIRFATGRQRKQLMRGRERTAISYAMETGRMDVREERQETMWGWEDEDFEKQRSRFETRKGWNDALADLQRERFDMQQQHHGESLALQKAQAEEQKVIYVENFEAQKEITDMQREFQIEQLERSKAAAGAGAAAAEEMNKLNDEMTTAQRNQKALFGDSQRQTILFMNNFQESFVKAVVAIVEAVGGDASGLVYTPYPVPSGIPPLSESAPSRGQQRK